MTEQNDEQRSALAHSMCHAMAVVTGVSKAFNNLKDTRMLGCFQLYYEVLQVFLTCLQVCLLIYIYMSCIILAVQVHIYKFLYCDWFA